MGESVPWGEPRGLAPGSSGVPGPLPAWWFPSAPSAVAPVAAWIRFLELPSQVTAPCGA